jgi:hypothetical protein
MNIFSCSGSHPETYFLSSFTIEAGTGRDLTNYATPLVALLYIFSIRKVSGAAKHNGRLALRLVFLYNYQSLADSMLWAKKKVSKVTILKSTKGWEG